jgi:hypothetical protein
MLHPKSRNLNPSCLARIEWDLLTQAKSIPDWQLLPMLHYEYARCYSPVIQAAQLLREAGRRNSFKSTAAPRIAKDLALDYPEFPGMSWVRLYPQRRCERLGKIGITEKSDLYPQEPAWKAWELFDPEADRLREELSQPAAESCGHFKIDFSQENRVIGEQFAKWLVNRRQELLRKYDRVVNLAMPRHQGGGSTINDNEIFLVKKTPIPKGREHKKRKCQDFLKALGALRALRYYSNDFSVAEEATALDADNCLYNNEASWHRAEIQSGIMMQRLAIAWERYGMDFDIFDWGGMAELIAHQELKEPIPTTESAPAKRNIAAIHIFIQENFALNAMSLEAPKL